MNPDNLNLRIMFVIHSLERGGAERVMSTMANYWSLQGEDVTIVTLETLDKDAYSLAAEVKRESLALAGESGNKLRGFWNNMRRWRKLRAVVQKLEPDVIVSFTTNINSMMILALLGIHVPLIISERVDPLYPGIGHFRKLLRRCLYPSAAALVVQTEHARTIMQHWFRSLRIRVIPNPVSENDSDVNQPHAPLRELLKVPEDARIIAGMGRLGPEKGFDLLIDSFSKVNAKHPDWHLVIFGEGRSRRELETRAISLGIQDKVHLVGLVLAARKYLAEADIFVLSSRHEGFPNVLLEAMACGLPVVSFDCNSGPGDIIRHEYDGLLVEPENALALEKAMTKLIEEPNHRRALARNAHGVTERFALPRIMGLWRQLIIENGLSK